MEGSIGTTRKALKLGKFLAGVHSLQQVSLKDKHAVLQIVALVGDTGYLFMQQIEWYAAIMANEELGRGRRRAVTD